MALPLISTNMYFDTVLKAIETVLKAESLNQIALGGTGWNTVRERFSPWSTGVDEFKPGVVNIVWSASNFPDSEGNNFDQSNIASFDLDCYASQRGIESAGAITPKDQRAADVLHTLITKVYFTIMSPINYDLGLIAGTIVRPWITSIAKFVPTEANVPILGVIAARISCRVKFEETPPVFAGVDLDEISLETSTADGGLVEQEFLYPWILRDGAWDDRGVWIDTETWNDEP